MSERVAVVEPERSICMLEVRPQGSAVPVVSRWRRLAVAMGRVLVGLRIALRVGGGLRGGIALLRRFVAADEARAAAGVRPAPRYVRFAGRFYRTLYAPGWPSRAFDRMVERQLVGDGGPQTAVVAITSRCTLRCRHCFEWDRLGGKEPLSLEHLRTIIDRLRRLGVTQVQLSGGEPLCRFDDLLALLREAPHETDFWMLTSGVGLTAARARALSDAGLTGVVISLDHHERERHDAFRGRVGAFGQALAAVGHARAADLVVALSLCARGEMANERDLEAYARLAAGLGVGFVQLLEPRAIGHYAGRDVALSTEQRTLLEAFYERVNFAPASEAAPIVEYPGLLCRRLGCQGGGRRTIYVDARGNIHRCPFSSDILGSALRDDTFAVDRGARHACEAQKTREVDDAQQG